jgi:hypothetical protein
MIRVSASKNRLRLTRNCASLRWRPRRASRQSRSPPSVASGTSQEGSPQRKAHPRGQGLRVPHDPSTKEPCSLSRERSGLRLTDCSHIPAVGLNSGLIRSGSGPCSGVRPVGGPMRSRAWQTLVDPPTETSKACNGVTRSWVQIPPPPLTVVRGRSLFGVRGRRHTRLRGVLWALGERSISPRWPQEGGYVPMSAE